MATERQARSHALPQWIGTFLGSAGELVDGLGSLMADAFHYLALFAIGATIVWSAGIAFLDTLKQNHANIEDILLLFIYLELGAMVGIYFKTNLMPVRCLIYIAITALSRLLISDIQEHHQPDMGILLVSGAILMLALSTLVVGRPKNAIETGNIATMK